MFLYTSPPAGTSLQLVPNSKFKIQNLPIPLALFRAHYRLKKRLSLWCIKENSEAVLLYFTNCKGVGLSTTHLEHYHYIFSVSLAHPAFLAFSLSRGVKPFFVFLIGIKDKMVTSSSVSSSGSSSSSSSLVLFQVTSLT